MLFAAGRCLFRAGGLFCFGKLLADGSTGLADAPVPVLLFVNQRIDADTVFHAGKVHGFVRQHGKQLVRVPAGCQFGKIGRYLHHKMILVRAVGSSQPFHVCRNALGLGLNQPGVQCRKMFFEITGPCRLRCSCRMAACRSSGSRGCISYRTNSPKYLSGRLSKCFFGPISRIPLS